MQSHSHRDPRPPERVVGQAFFHLTDKEMDSGQLWDLTKMGSSQVAGSQLGFKCLFFPPLCITRNPQESWL